MKPRQSEGDGPLHQTVATGYEFKSGGKSIAVEFTEQKLSGQAGTAPFWAMAAWHRLERAPGGGAAASPPAVEQLAESAGEGAGLRARAAGRGAQAHPRGVFQA